MSVCDGHFEIDLQFITKSKWVNCIAHQIELIVGVVYDKSLSGHKVLHRILDLITAIKNRRKINKQLIKRCGKSVIGLAPTRWSSLSRVLERFLEIQHLLLQVSQ
jgi:hypothetical protein